MASQELSFMREGVALQESDDEEACEREEFHIEEALRQFRDEPPVTHNEYPHNDSDVEVEDVEKERFNVRRGDGRLYPNQVFVNGVGFKEAVVDYALRTGRNLKQNRYDKDKISYICVGNGCNWRIYCSVSGKSGKWQVKGFKDEHTCVPSGECEMLKVPVIARLFVEKIRDNPDYFMPLKIEEIIKDRWKITVSRGKCQAARNKAIRWIEKEYDEQFARLRDYKAEILHSNVNSTVIIDTYTNANGEDVFDRFYVCFDILRRTWKSTCRKLVGVDGCFLRSKMKGQLLVALGRDANNAIYPIAWAVVQVENTDNWHWFVKNIKKDFGLMDGKDYILISDRQKGLIKAVEIELPNIEHRMCVICV